MRSVKYNFEKISDPSGRFYCLQRVGFRAKASRFHNARGCGDGPFNCEFRPRSPSRTNSNDHRNRHEAHQCPQGNPGHEHYHEQGVGQRQGLSLCRQQVLRQDQARPVYVRSRRKGQGFARSPRSSMLTAGYL